MKEKNMGHICPIGRSGVRTWNSDMEVKVPGVNFNHQIFMKGILN